MISKAAKFGALAVLCAALAACGSRPGSGLGSGAGSSGGDGRADVLDAKEFNKITGEYESVGPRRNGEGTIWELFSGADAGVTVNVNKYLWNASLETLNFLPVETVDPFTGVLVFGWGRAPGSRQTYRATVLVQDPALDARSLKLSIQTRGGPASAETTRRIEDAIMTRARQLRVRDSSL